MSTLNQKTIRWFSGQRNNLLCKVLNILSTPQQVGCCGDDLRLMVVILHVAVVVVVEMVALMIVLLVEMVVVVVMEMVALMIVVLV